MTQILSYRPPWETRVYMVMSGVRQNFQRASNEAMGCTRSVLSAPMLFSYET